MLPGLLPESALAQPSLRLGAQLNAWPTLLVLDDDADMARTLVCFFEKRGFHVAAGSTLADAREFFHRRKNWTLIISSYYLPDGTGAELYDWIREQGYDVPMLFTSGNPHCSTPCTGLNFLPKPFSIEALADYVRNVHRAR